MSTWTVIIGSLEPPFDHVSAASFSSPTHRVSRMAFDLSSKVRITRCSHVNPKLFTFCDRRLGE